MIDLRPLSLGEIVDRSASFWRANWLGLFKLALGFQLGWFALIKGWEVIIGRYFPLALGGQRMMEALKTEPDEAFRQLAAMMLGLGGIIVFYVLINLFSGVATTAFAWPRLVGKPATTIGDSLNLSLARSGKVFNFFLLMIGWSLLVSILFMLPGGALIGLGALLGKGVGAAICIAFGALGATLGGVIAIVWFILRYLLASQVLALEEVSAMDAFRRCATLSSGRVEPGVIGLVKVRLAVMVTVVGLILTLVTLLFSVPALIIQGAYGNALDPLHATPEAVPQLLLVPAELLQVAAQAAVSPLFVVFSLIFYADMRVRREALDLELKLGEAKA
jgi:hypothetical protein